MCYYIWIVFFCCLGRVVTLEEEEDDPCVLPTGESGICKIVTNCSYALNLLRNHQTPNICGFEGHVPIVCCKTTQETTVSPFLSGNSTPKISTTTSPHENVGALSRKNDSCVLPTGERGICKIATNCSYALNLLRNYQTPNICGFEEHVPLVCCKTTQETTASPFLLGNSATTSPHEDVGALSRKKCVKFYPKPRHPILIAGGKPSLVREFPHMAIIGFGEQNDIQWQCGGSLISENFVLTAAHCLRSRDLGDAKWVRIGDLDLSTEKDDARPQNFTIKRRIPHPSYEPPVRYHDIALLELDRNVTFSVYRSPACLNTEHYLKQKRMTATGWGKTAYSGGVSSFLLKVDLSYVPNSQCAVPFKNVDKRFLPNGIIDDFQICAGGVVGEDTCQGDSGGPLQVKNEDRSFKIHVHTVMGVTSFGKACGLSNAPGIYTRVSNYIPWIESIVWPNETT